MGNSGIVIGGITGAVITGIIFAVFLFSQADVPEPEIIVSNGHDPNIVGEVSTYTKNMSLIEIFEKSEPGVVSVNVQRFDTIDRSGVGSGFVFDKRGHIITNAHVVVNAQKIIVTFLDGRSYNAEIIGLDNYTDIGVIKVNADHNLSLIHI